MVADDFINEGKKHMPGTSLHLKAGKVQGPHTTDAGCTFLVLWTDRAATQQANLDDFSLPMAA